MTHNLPVAPAQRANNQIALPAHLAAQVAQARVFARAGNRLKYISLRQGQFIVPDFADNGGELQLPNPLVCVILDAQPAIGRAYYASAYDPEQKNVLPACWSSDGISSSEKAPNRQSAQCADCVRNVKGSASNGKGKACAFGRRIVVWVQGYDEPFALKLGGMSSFTSAKEEASLKNQNKYMFEGYLRQLASQGLDPSWVFTSFSYQTKQSVPALFTSFNFDAAGNCFVDADTLAHTQRLAADFSEEIKEIVAGEFDAGAVAQAPVAAPATPAGHPLAAVMSNHPMAAYTEAPQVSAPVQNLTQPEVLVDNTTAAQQQLLQMQQQMQLLQQQMHQSAVSAPPVIPQGWAAPAAPFAAPPAAPAPFAAPPAIFAAAPEAAYVAPPASYVAPPAAAPMLAEMLGSGQVTVMSDAAAGVADILARMDTEVKTSQG